MGDMQMYDVDGWSMHRCVHTLTVNSLQFRQQAHTLSVVNYSL